MLYIVVQCPHCGRYSIFIPRTERRHKWVKKCPFCNRQFFVVPKRRFSRAIKVFYDKEMATKFVAQKNEEWVSSRKLTKY